MFIHLTTLDSKHFYLNLSVVDSFESGPDGTIILPKKGEPFGVSQTMTEIGRVLVSANKLIEPSITIPRTTKAE